jgi:hypothetical protein
MGMERLQKLKEAAAHKAAVARLWIGNPGYRNSVSLWRVAMHDLGKLFCIALFGDSLATDLHRKFAGHHKLDNPSQPDFAEAYLDWASARVTKPSKPLDAVQTAQRFYPHLLDMAVNHYNMIGVK